MFSDLFSKDFFLLAPGGICDGEWNLERANSPLRELLKIDGENLPRGALSEWLASGVLENLADEEQGKISCSGKSLFRHNSGTAFLFSWHTNPEDNQKRCFLIQPIPLERLNLAALDSVRELENILDFIHDGIWVIDGKGITRRINRAMERIAGIRADEVVGRHVSEPLKEGRFKTCVTLSALQKRHTVTLFDDYSNGKRCLNTSAPVFDADGNVLRVIAAIRDITELDELQNKLSSLEVEALAYRLRAQGLENLSRGVLIGQSAILKRTLQNIAKAADTDAVTLLLGETGAGKSVAAKTIHELSSRAERPFVTVNCGAIPAELMESEIFGYESGAFTGAAKGGKPGVLELAAGGTLLLDEIGELPLPLQAKLLHLLDGQPVYRVGGIRPISPNARILAATNRNLEKMISLGTFREDLFYRLRILCVEMPPLRERRDDILVLAWRFLQKFNDETGKNRKLDPRVERLFLAYSWPGNVRELQNVIRSLAILCESDRIMPEDLPSYMRKNAESPQKYAPAAKTLAEAVRDTEKNLIVAALARAGSTYKAARELGMSQASVARKAKKYGIGARRRENNAYESSEPQSHSGQAGIRDPYRREN